MSVKHEVPINWIIFHRLDKGRKWELFYIKDILNFNKIFAKYQWRSSFLSRFYFKYFNTKLLQEFLVTWFNRFLFFEICKTAFVTQQQWLFNWILQVDNFGPLIGRQPNWPNRQQALCFIYLRVIRSPIMALGPNAQLSTSSDSNKEILYCNILPENDQ